MKLILIRMVGWRTSCLRGFVVIFGLIAVATIFAQESKPAADQADLAQDSPASEKQVRDQQEAGTAASHPVPDISGKWRYDVTSVVVGEKGGKPAISTSTATAVMSRVDASETEFIVVETVGTGQSKWHVKWVPQKRQYERTSVIAGNTVFAAALTLHPQADGKSIQATFQWSEQIKEIFRRHGVTEQQLEKLQSREMRRIDPSEIAQSDNELNDPRQADLSKDANNAQMPDITGTWSRAKDGIFSKLKVWPVQNRETMFFVECPEGDGLLEWRTEWSRYVGYFTFDAVGVRTAQMYVAFDRSTDTHRLTIVPFQDQRKQLLRSGFAKTERELDTKLSSEWNRAEAPAQPMPMMTVAVVKTQLEPHRVRDSVRSRVPYRVFSNDTLKSVIVIAPADAQDEIEALIHQLDVDEPEKSGATLNARSATPANNQSGSGGKPTAELTPLGLPSPHELPREQPVAAPLHHLNSPEARKLSESIAEHEAKARLIADEIRSLSKTHGTTHPKVVESQRQLNETLGNALAAKFQLEQLQITSMEEKLAKLKTQIGQRQAASKQIVGRRARELIEGDALKWDASDINPKNDLTSLSGNVSRIGVMGSGEQCSLSFAPQPIDILREFERQRGIKQGAVTGIYAKNDQSIRIVVEPVNDGMDPPMDYPLIGNACRHRIRYRCTINFKQVESIQWPAEAKFDKNGEVTIYFDAEHLHRQDGVAFDPKSVNETSSQGAVPPSAQADQRSQLPSEITGGHPTSTYQEFAQKLLSIDSSVAEAEESLALAEREVGQNVVTNTVPRARRRLEDAIRNRKVILDEYAAVLRDLELQVESAQVAVDAAKKDTDRARQLVEKNVISQQESKDTQFREKQAELALERIKVRYELYKGVRKADVAGESDSAKTLPTPQEISAQLEPIAKRVNSAANRVRTLETQYLRDRSGAVDLTQALKDLQQARSDWWTHIKRLEPSLNLISHKSETAKLRAESLSKRLEAVANQLAEGKATEAEMNAVAEDHKRASEAMLAGNALMESYLTAIEPYKDIHTDDTKVPSHREPIQIARIESETDPEVALAWLEAATSLKLEFFHCDDLNLWFKAALRVRESSGKYKAGDLIVILNEHLFHTLGEATEALSSKSRGNFNDIILRGGLAGHQERAHFNGEPLIRYLRPGDPVEKPNGNAATIPFEVRVRGEAASGLRTEYLLGTCVAPDGLVVIPVLSKSLVPGQPLIPYGKIKGTARVVATDDVHGLTLVKLESPNQPLFHWWKCHLGSPAKDQRLNCQDEKGNQYDVSVSEIGQALTKPLVGNDAFVITGASVWSLPPGIALLTVDRELQGITILGEPPPLERKPQDDDPGNRKLAIPAVHIDKLIKNHRKASRANTDQKQEGSSGS